MEIMKIHENIKRLNSDDKMHVTKVVLYAWSSSIMPKLNVITRMLCGLDAKNLFSIKFTYSWFLFPSCHIGMKESKFHLHKNDEDMFYNNRLY